MEKVLLSLAAITLLGSLFLMNQPTTQVGVDADVQAQFQQYKKTYNKKYSSEEDNYRLQVFAQNLQQIQTFNEKKGEEVMGVTLFADLTDEEFQSTYLTQLAPVETTRTLTFNVQDVNASIDWVAKGAVTPIKNQGQCGSCWAFSTTGVLEGFFFRTQGTLPSLSEQQLVDCAGLIYGNLGCNGGMPARALRYVAKNGLTTEAEYPYKAVKGSCTKNGGAYKVNGSSTVQASDDGLIGALQDGPVSVAVDATNWKNYKQGVFEDCDVKLNHAVLAVGYDATSYRIKNSWTTGWGEAGFIRIKRANTCGVYNAMVVPN